MLGLLLRALPRQRASKLLARAVTVVGKCTRDVRSYVHSSNCGISKCWLRHIVIFMTGQTPAAIGEAIVNDTVWESIHDLELVPRCFRLLSEDDDEGKVSPLVVWAGLPLLAQIWSITVANRRKDLERATSGYQRCATLFRTQLKSTIKTAMDLANGVDIYLDKVVGRHDSSKALGDQPRLGISGNAFLVPLITFLDTPTVLSLLPRIMSSTIKLELGGADRAAAIFNEERPVGMTGFHKIIREIYTVASKPSTEDERERESEVASDANRHGYSVLPASKDANHRTCSLSGVDLLVALHAVGFEPTEVKYLALHSTKLRLVLVQLLLFVLSQSVTVP